MGMSLDDLIAKLESMPETEASVRLLIDEIADRLDAIGNFGEINHLAGDLRLHANALVRATAHKRPKVIHLPSTDWGED